MAKDAGTDLAALFPIHAFQHARALPVLLLSVDD